MNTIRMNITVPIDIGKHLKGIKNISAFISEALREKFQRQEEEKKKKELDVAYRASAEEEVANHESSKKTDHKGHEGTQKRKSAQRSAKGAIGGAAVARLQPPLSEWADV